MISPQVEEGTLMGAFFHWLRRISIGEMAAGQHAESCQIGCGSIYEQVSLDLAGPLFRSWRFVGGTAGAGFSSLYANEIVPRYAQTYALNHPHTCVDSRDIRTVDAGKFAKCWVCSVVNWALLRVARHAKVSQSMRQNARRMIRATICSANICDSLRNFSRAQ